MAQGEQLIYLNLSEMTNWNGTYSNWWLQLVENPGDGPVPSAGEVIIDRILFTNVNNAPPAFHDVTFNVDARNIIVHDKGMYMGGGILGGADAVAMSDEDGDGIVSDEELSHVKAIKETETALRKNLAQLRMARFTLIAMGAFTAAMFFVPLERVEALADISNLFYISGAGIVGAYMGTTAWMARK